MSKKTITIALTGASGMPYGIRLLEVLLQQGHQVYLLYSQAAQIVAQQEMALTLSSRPKETEIFLNDYFDVEPGLLRVFGREEWFAPVASGSNPADAMVICPCTMGTLSAVAAGMGQKLIERAADVMLKEQRKLILVARETPFSIIHLENMLKLARSGAVILPANPGFYHLPESIQDVIDFIVARVLDQLGVTHTLIPRWGDSEQL
ncbi:UbiX family flavin prenyltransferase [Nitrosomonas sp. HPC101]|uniref:flavin prenyltransferase UbiX n=1 Tax=Nitrosomonas sp. HPC101 TaxID=1658667 RepID=UPI0013717662|nr:flavin prenyltransferase UbiX [Nitrosomonas sp. HPC101]MXS86109.1 UbiX family flavin prenyltransferase [Nitrosomonas sp. HPC101]